MTIDLVLHPSSTKPGRYSAHWPGGVLVRSSRQPLLDAARILLDLGEPPETELTTQHAGSAIVAQRSTVGEAAKWTVSESDRGGLRRARWQPHPMASRSCAVDPEIERSAAE